MINVEIEKILMEENKYDHVTFAILKTFDNNAMLQESIGDWIILPVEIFSDVT